MILSLKIIIKNTLIVYFIEIINKVFLFTFIVFAARMLGLKIFGDLSFALTLYLLLQILSDFGLTTFLTRETAQNPAEKDKIFRIAFHIRIVVTFILFMFLILYLYLTRASSEITLFVILAGFGLIFSGYAQTFILTLRGLNLMKLDGLIRLGGTFVTTILGLAALRIEKGITGIACALLLGNIATVLVSLPINRRYGIIKKPASDLTLANYFLMAKKSLPFITMVVLVNIFTRVDTLLLQHLKGSAEVGLYHASFKVMDALLIFQAAFGMVIFPVLSRHVGEGNMDVVRHLTQLGIKYMYYIGIFLALFTFMTADKIIEILYFSREYNNAVWGLQIFSIVTLIIYISTPVGYLLLSTRFSNLVPLIQILMVVLSLTLNLILIPHYGFVGAAVVRLATEVLGLSLSMILIDRVLFRINYLAELSKPVIAGFAVGIFIFFTKSLLFVPLYFTMYVSILYFLGGISVKEFAFIKELALERFNRQ